MDFIFGLEQPNGAGKAILFYIVHLVTLLVILFIIGFVFAAAIGTFERGGVIGIMGAIVYSSLLCIWVIYRRQLNPASYAFVLLVIPAAFILGGFLGLILPAVLTTRGT